MKIKLTHFFKNNTQTQIPIANIAGGGRNTGLIKPKQLFIFSALILSLRVDSIQTAVTLAVMILLTQPVHSQASLNFHLPVFAVRMMARSSFINNNGNLWSRSVSGTYSVIVSYNSSISESADYFRAFGFSVRCIKDE